MWDRRGYLRGKRMTTRDVNVLPPSCVLAAITSSSGVGGRAKHFLKLFQLLFTTKESAGWSLLPKQGTLRAVTSPNQQSRNGGSDNHQSITHVQVFVVREDFHDKTRSVALLQVRSKVAVTTRNRSSRGGTQ
jgi:hypothetical protein